MVFSSIAPELPNIEDFGGNGFEHGQKASESIQGRAKKWEMGWDGPGPTVPIWGDMLTLAMGSAADETPNWGYYPFLRDKYLDRLYRSETHMSGVVYSVQAKVRSLPWAVRVKGKPRATVNMQDVFGRAGLGKGFSHELGKGAIDLCTKDNGFFFELVGKSDRRGRLIGPVTDIMHIDSLCCWRTHDPEYPVIYTNPLTGTYHSLHKSKVITGSSMTSPHELARGIGFCAVSRTLKAIQMMRDIKIYQHEKVAGKFNRAIGWGSGITTKQFNKAIKQASDEDDNAGLIMYRRIPFILSQNEHMDLNMLDLASLPDGFDPEKETNLYMYCLALGFGTDAREFWPATATGATKADAAIQHLKARDKGFADLLTTFGDAFNWHDSLPEGFILEFDYVDDEQDAEVARIHGIKIDNLDKMVRMGSISPEEARAQAVSWGIVNIEVLNSNKNPIPASDTAPITLEEATGPEDEHGAPRQPTANANDLNKNVPSDKPETPNIVKNMKELGDGYLHLCSIMEKAAPLVERIAS